MLGIIGGMGPLATQIMYKKLIEKTVAECDQQHIDMIILSHASMPDRTTAIKADDTDKIYSLLLKDAKMLEKNECKMIGIPCNTSHYFVPKLQTEINIPIVNMVSESVNFMVEKGHKKIAILATDGTNESKLYHKECEKVGIECITLSEKVQKTVMKIIYKQIKKGEHGNLYDFKIIDDFIKRENCDGAILACTEYSVFKEHHRISDFYVDALDVLCEKMILMSGKEIKKSNECKKIFEHIR